MVAISTERLNIRSVRQCYGEKGAVVRDSILMPGVTVQEGAVLDKCIVANQTIIGKMFRRALISPNLYFPQFKIMQRWDHRF